MDPWFDATVPSICTQVVEDRNALAMPATARCHELNEEAEASTAGDNHG